jgi:glycosyltransferase involved in cell wall biosynthesis
MSLTAVVTSHDYARYLPRCIDSALEFCDEVLVYDDGSTDDSMQVLASYGGRIRVMHRDDASGGPVWGSNLGIKQATSTHLVYLDADNYLLRRPPTNGVDYTFGDIRVVDADGVEKRHWRYPSWPLDPDVCWQRFVSQAVDKHSYQMPFPWGGVWRTSFLAGKRWRRFETPGLPSDYRTALDWIKARPALAHDGEPFLAFRRHGQQITATQTHGADKSEILAIAMYEAMPRVSGDSPDLVYVCKDAADNIELRYSLRSIEANLPHGRVWVFGGKPDWACNVEHVPFAQSGTRFENTTAGLRAACEHPGVSDPFLLMNDDFYVMRATDVVPVMCLGTISETIDRFHAERRANRGSGYVVEMGATRDLLEALGFTEPLSYEMHAPLLVHKAAMLDAIELVKAAGLEGAHKRSVYGALAFSDALRCSDVKVFDKRCPVPANTAFLSSVGKCFDRVRPLLEGAFAKPSPYELGGRYCPPPPPLPPGSMRFPVPLAHDCELGGKRYPKGMRVDREAALALKAAGQLTDPRIR